ncbi:MAG: DUF2029 domain-containing protein, partial [Actinobacteria bacterium]|nr:DUF2029 domain-containing protein [Actinomycetota bacterium]
MPHDVPVIARDEVTQEASERFGGPVGRFARPSAYSLVRSLRALVLLATFTHLVGYVMRLPCRTADFLNSNRYPRMCYTDMPYLFTGRGFDVGHLPYLSAPPQGAESLEYPVLTGWFMQLGGWLTHLTASNAVPAVHRASIFYDWNAVLLGGCFVIAVVAVALSVPGRPWDAALVALAPTVVMTGLINWDLFAVALFAICMMLWLRRRPLWAGVFFGLAVSAKFYPIVVLPAFFVVALRARSLRLFFKFAVASTVVWLMVNIPFIVINVHEWARFYTFSRERGSDFGSLWLASQYLGADALNIDSLNLWAFVIFAVLGALILVLGLISPRPPRLAQLAFLLVVAFCVSNKVYSPQYVLWLVPLAAMARPRWREYMVWQISQVVYAMSVWLFLASTDGDGKGQGINALNYAWIIIITVAVTLWFAALVVRDIMYPEGDIVRTREFDADMSAVESELTAGAEHAAGGAANEVEDSRSSQDAGVSAGSDAGAPASDDEDAALSSPEPTSVD